MHSLNNKTAELTELSKQRDVTVTRLIKTGLSTDVRHREHGCLQKLETQNAAVFLSANLRK